MTDIAAGFDRISPIANLDDVVMTAGLANCIAVAAIDLVLGGMRMAHYNTVNCAVSTSEGLRFERGPLARFKDWFARDNVLFKVGVGLIWENRGTEARHDLLIGLKEVFHHEPIVVGSSIRVRFDENENPVMEGCKHENWMPAGWANAGTEIPYADFR